MAKYYKNHNQPVDLKPGALDFEAMVLVSMGLHTKAAARKLGLSPSRVARIRSMTHFGKQATATREGTSVFIKRMMRLYADGTMYKPAELDNMAKRGRATFKRAANKAAARRKKIKPSRSRKKRQ